MTSITASLNHYITQIITSLQHYTTSSTASPQPLHDLNQYITAIITQLQQYITSTLRHFNPDITSIIASLKQDITSLIKSLYSMLLKLLVRSGSDATKCHCNAAYIWWVWCRDWGGSCFGGCGYAGFMVGIVRAVGAVSRFEKWGGCLRTIVFCEAGLQIAGLCSSCWS